MHAAFPSRVIVIAFRLPPFGREVLGVSRAVEGAHRGRVALSRLPLIR